MTYAERLSAELATHSLRRADGAGEPYALYLAYAETHHGHGIVKVGVTVEPYRRLYEIHMGCPFPIITFIWAWAGAKAFAYQIETAMKNGWSEDRLRGEWFKRDIPVENGQDRVQGIRQSLKMSFARTRLCMDWQDGNIDDVIAFNNARAKAAAKPKKPKPRKKPWESWR